MTQPQPEDQVDLINITLPRNQLMALLDGNVVRVDIPAARGIPPTVVILRHARTTTAARDEATE